MKALNYHLKENKKFLGLFPVRKHPLFILYPVIIFDGHLYNCVWQYGGPIVSPVDYIQYKTSLREDVFLIDIIKKEAFPKYLDELQLEIKTMKSALKT